jgi:hypothetical protein
MCRAPGGTLMVAPATQDFDLFKIAGRSIFLSWNVNWWYFSLAILLYCMVIVGRRARMLSQAGQMSRSRRSNYFCTRSLPLPVRRAVRKGGLWLFCSGLLFFLFIFLPWKLLQGIRDDAFLLSGRSASTTGTVTHFYTLTNTSLEYPYTTFSCGGKLTFQPAGGQSLTIGFNGWDWLGQACANTFDLEQVTVLYNPDHPSDAGIDSFVKQELDQDIIDEILTGILGLILLVPYLVTRGRGVFSWLKRLRTHQKTHTISR